MAASGDDSTITTLSNSGCFKNYGSVRKTALTSGTLEHLVRATDTIEGIAIKYGVSVEEIMKVNRLWNRESLFSKSIIKIPVNDYNFDIYDRQSTEGTTNTREEAVLREAHAIQPQSKVQPSLESANGVKRIDNILEGADDELMRALQFQAKLASRWSGFPSEGYNRESVEVTYKTQQHVTGSRRAVKTSLTTDSQKKQLETADEDMFEL